MNGSALPAAWVGAMSWPALDGRISTGAGGDVLSTTSMKLRITQWQTLISFLLIFECRSWRKTGYKQVNQIKCMYYFPTVFGVNRPPELHSCFTSLSILELVMLAQITTVSFKIAANVATFSRPIPERIYNCQI